MVVILFADFRRKPVAKAAAGILLDLYYGIGLSIGIKLLSSARPPSLPTCTYLRA